MFYLDYNIEAITPKKADNLKVFFRYARVRKTFQSIIANTPTSYNLITSQNDILEISNQTGGLTE